MKIHLLRMLLLFLSYHDVSEMDVKHTTNSTLYWVNTLIKLCHSTQAELNLLTELVFSCFDFIIFPSQTASCRVLSAR